MNDKFDKKAEAIMLELAKVEMLAKAQLCQLAEEHAPDNKSDQVLIITATAMAMAAAALNAATQAVTERGDNAVGKMTLGFFNAMIGREWANLCEAMEEASK